MMDTVYGQQGSRATPPPPGPIRPFHLPDVRSETLANGLVVKSMAMGRIPLVSVCLVFDAGEVTVPSERAGLAGLTGDALLGGTKQWPAPELAEILERMGTSLRVSTSWDAMTVSFTSVAERLEEVLSVLSSVVREPSFPTDEVERLRRQRLAVLQQRRKEPSELARDALSRNLFSSEHPYHRPLPGLDTAVQGLDDGHAREFAGQRLSPVGSGMVLVGDLEEAQVADLAARHLGTWEGTAVAPLNIPDIQAPAERSIVLVHRPGAVQSELRIGHPAPDRGHPDEVIMRVVNAILGGAFTSRLNLKLREEHGFTYGVHSRFALRRQGGLFAIGTAVQTEVTVPALREAMDVFQAFSDSGPTSDELVRARDYLAGTFPLRLETAAQRAARVAELVVFGLPDHYHHEWRDRVRAVDPEAAARVAREHLHPERSVIAVVGDADRLHGDLSELGWGPVEVWEE